MMRPRWNTSEFKGELFAEQGMAIGRYRCSILVVDDEPAIRAILTALLGSEFEVHTAESVERGRELFQGRKIDILVADQRMPGGNGLQLIEWVRRESPRTVRILMTGKASLEDAIEAINCGEVHRYILKPWLPEQMLQIVRHAARTFLLERSHEELLRELRRLNLELEQRVAERTRELEAANRELQQKNMILQKMALTDALTGLPNRRAMDRLAKTELLRRTRTPSAFCLGLIDADHFKEINSRFLLSGGDHALNWLGQTLAGSIRTVDTVGRVGGEEFMLVAPETNSEGARILGERIRRNIEIGSTIFNEQEIRLTVSAGLVVAGPDYLVSYDQMRHSAALALSEAKGTGRNRVIVRELTSSAQGSTNRSEVPNETSNQTLGT